MRIAVIGSGIVGSSVGWHLARRGAEVVMLDAAQPGAGVTNWTFSWLNASNKTQTRAYFDLNVAGMAAYRELAGDISGGQWWHPTGHLRWSDNPTGVRELHDVADRLESWDYDVELWDADRVRRFLEPSVLFPTDDSEIVFYPGEGWIDGPVLVRRFIDEMVDGGAEAHFGSEVTDVVVSGEHITGIVLSGGERVQVDAIVNAAGPGGRRVARLVGRTLPMCDEPGCVARFRCERIPVRRAMHAPRIEIRPDRPGQVVLHSRDVDALIDQAAAASDLAAALHRLSIDVVPALDEAELIEARVVQRPIPGDGFPSVGGIEGLTGYFEAVTHSGISLGVILGRLLAHEIIDGTVHELIEPYRPDRFADVE
jgi:glycine/D-amino acid oxidase-like deaminating enzyme